MRLIARLAAVLLLLAPGLLAAQPAAAITTAQAIASDPPADAKNPARLEFVRVPSGGGYFYARVLVAAGAGPHPTFVLFHGLPGQEQNMDLAQAVRRAGWTVVTLNYRGSWGSPGSYRFAGDLEDAASVLTYIRDPANAARLGIDPARIAIGGHSLGGWVTAWTAAHDDHLLGAVMISAGDLGGAGLFARTNRKTIVDFMQDSHDGLADTDGERMTDELVAHGPEWSFKALAPRLKDRRLLVLYGDDFVTANSTDLINGVKAAGGTRIQSVQVHTDHSWSDRRIALQTLVIDWLQGLL
jgi:pimeloyl-ACP methyl ester carboxylesterase